MELVGTMAAGLLPYWRFVYVRGEKNTFHGYVWRYQHLFQFPQIDMRVSKRVVIERIFIERINVVIHDLTRSIDTYFAVRRYVRTLFARHAATPYWVAAPLGMPEVEASKRAEHAS